MDGRKIGAKLVSLILFLEQKKFLLSAFILIFVPVKFAFRLIIISVAAATSGVHQKNSPYMELEAQGLSCVKRTIPNRNQVGRCSHRYVGIKKVMTLVGVVSHYFAIPGKQRDVELVLRNNNTCLLGVVSHYFAASSSHKLASIGMVDKVRVSYHAEQRVATSEIKSTLSFCRNSPCTVLNLHSKFLLFFSLINEQIFT